MKSGRERGCQKFSFILRTIRKCFPREHWYCTQTETTQKTVAKKFHYSNTIEAKKFPPVQKQQVESRIQCGRFTQCSPLGWRYSISETTGHLINKKNSKSLNHCGSSSHLLSLHMHLQNEALTMNTL